MCRIHPILLIFLICFVNCQYSYFDKCYRYENYDGSRFQHAYQYYKNTRGEIHSVDNLVLQRNKKYYDWSYYYHYALSNCKMGDNSVLVCDSKCESVWFKLLNTEEEPSTTWARVCDPIFLKKYGDVTKHHCTGIDDPFVEIKKKLGEEKRHYIRIVDGVPMHLNAGYKAVDECIWEYDVMGLVSIITLVIIGIVVVVCLISAISLIVIVQKTRSNKRKRLDNSLLKDQVELV